MEGKGRSTAYDGLDVGTPVSVGTGHPEAGSGASVDDVLDADDRGLGLRVQRGVRQLEDIIQHYPWPTVLLGIGVGFLLARRMR